MPVFSGLYLALRFVFAKKYDDNKGILTAVQMLLGTCFEKVITISTPNKIKATLHDENIDVVLLDMNFSAGINTGNEGLFWLSEIKKEDASIQVRSFHGLCGRGPFAVYGESRKDGPIAVVKALG